MDESAIPNLPRGVRVKHDKVRERWVLLAPERVVNIDAVGHAILSEIDGQRSFGAIIDLLAAKYNAPRDQIAGDSAKFLGALIERRFMDFAPGEAA